MTAASPSVAAWPAGVSTLADEPTFWMPVQASDVAGSTDWLFHFLLYLSTFFFLLIVGLMILFVLRYRRRSVTQLGGGPTHNTALEMIWTGIPILLAAFVFVVGFRDFMRIFGPAGAANAYEIQVTGQKWKWQFTYPNGLVDENLHLPPDTPIELTMTSEDVIHGFFIPAFRIKKDVVPGRYGKLYFRATRPGEYVLYCTQYCGTNHSQMMAKVLVHQPGEFEKWLAGAASAVNQLPPAQLGEQLFRTRGCATCHSVDGSPLIGPTVKGAFGHDVVLTTGGKVKADENYVRESILEPNAKIVAGYDPVMPTFQGRLSDKEITALIEYIKALK